MIGNCDVWETVDFGKGPVEIRCTKVGVHSFHTCEVRFEGNPEATRQNIFEKEQ